MPMIRCGKCARLGKLSTCAFCRSEQIARRNASSPYLQADWQALTRAVKDRDGNVCKVRGCDSTSRLTAHHKIARVDGGPDSMANLVTLCGKCHSQFEADIRRGLTTSLVREVEAL